MYVVVLDNEQDISVLCGPDPECAGGLKPLCGTGAVATFSTETLARRAVRITRKWNSLRREQGKPFSDDFAGANARFIKIFQCVNRDTKHDGLPKGEVSDVYTVPLPELFRFNWAAYDASGCLYVYTEMPVLYLGVMWETSDCNDKIAELWEGIEGLPPFNEDTWDKIVYRLSIIDNNKVRFTAVDVS